MDGGHVRTDPAPRFDPASLIRHGANWTRWIGPVISVGILAVVIWQLSELDIDSVLALLPVSPLFWMLFALCYFAGPLSEWIIFRKLWRIPLSGFRALLGKMISNELLLGYLGEVYFYAWVRRRQQITTAPFGAIKDVAILSALSGNIFTLAMLALAFPFVGHFDLGPHARAIYFSIGFVLLISLVIGLFRRRLFSLPNRDLWMIFSIHLARLGGIAALTAYLWHLVLPAVAIGYWLLLATTRLLISRLPFLPNKDIAFVGIAVLLVGRDGEIASLMALMASLIFVTHLLLGALLSGIELFREETYV